MRVLYVLHNTIPTDGSTKAILGLISLLREKGVTPIFLVPDTKGIFHSLLEQGYDTYAIPFKLSIYPNSKTTKDLFTFVLKLICRIAINIVALYRIKKLIKRLHPDIVHTNTSVVSLGRIAAKSIGIPHIQHIREYGSKEFSTIYFPSWRFVHRQIRNHNTFNVCITKDIQRHHGLNQCNSVVIYDGVHPKMTSIPASNKQNYVLYAGRIEYGKGLDILLTAYRNYIKEVQHPIPLKIAGGISDQNYHDSIKTYISQNRLSSHVTYLGEVDNIEALMQEAKALIIPSRAEGFGFCMPEAMFNGCLCIGNRVAGTKEQMDNGLEYTGQEIALSFITHEELTTQLIKVHNSNKEYWTDILIRAFNTVNSFYTREGSANAVYDLYKVVKLRQ